MCMIFCFSPQYPLGYLRKDVSLEGCVLLRGIGLRYRKVCWVTPLVFSELEHYRKSGSLYFLGYFDSIQYTFQNQGLV